MSTIVLHCVSSLSRETGVPRQKLRGIISGLNLTVYQGHKNSVAIDDAGRETLMSHLRDEGLIDVDLG